MRAAFAALLLLGLARCAPPPQGCALALATEVPLVLTLHDTKLALPATLDHTPVMLMLDTGSEFTVIDQRLLGVDELTTVSGALSGIGGRRSAVLARLQGLQIGRLHGAALPAVAGWFGQDLSARGFAGVLGMDVMGAYDIDLDLQSAQARFFKSSGLCATPGAVMRQPLYAIPELPPGPHDARPHVAVEIAGQSFEGLLDTGSPGVLLSGRAARRLGLTEASLGADRALQVGGVGERRVTGRVHLIDSLSLGDLTMHRVPALVLQEDYDPRVDVILGMDFVKRVHVWLSSSSHSLVVQIPPTPSPPL